MPSNPQRKLPFQPARRAFRTLQGWALGTLIEHGAVVECDDHGYRLDRADPDAWNRAREEAWRNPFPGVTRRPASLRWRGDPAIGDTCPDCE